ncbi:MAG: radical SAM family heme chaperone HemW [Bacteroides sp.]|nr:radical SAM family heme chaperone HemW [Bacteroides sp.]
MAGLYVHIPYCRAKCAYCDFYSGPLRIFNEEQFFRAVDHELAARRSEVGEFLTVYIGGGTPSAVDPARLAPYLSLAEGERTVEVNPDDITPQLAEGLLRAGANRISMGVQSLNDDELRAIGRRHTAAGARRAYDILRQAGFTNISLDLIYGLPGQDFESWRRSLGELLDWEPQHLSAYILSYEPGTLLTGRLKAGKIQEATEELIERMYDHLCLTTRAAGFNHYEISNFALPGFEARHNSSYWDMTPYLGLGPGAHSFDGTVRRENPANLKAYLADPENFAQVEEETDDNRFNDRLITSLRTAAGIECTAFSAAELALARKLLEPVGDNRLRIPEKEWLRSNSLLLQLIR